MIRTGMLIGAAAFIAYAGQVGAAETASSSTSGPTTERSSSANPPPASSAPLDLRAPDITRIYTAEQIRLVLSKALDRNIAEVEVEGVRERRPPAPRTPEVWSGIAAPFWALLHPLEAWRILAPLPPDQANAMINEPFDATSGFLEPAAADGRRF